MDDFYVNLQIEHFMGGTPISFANPEVTKEYTHALESRGIAYRIVNGLGMHGLESVICRPEEAIRWRTQLLCDIRNTREELERRLLGLAELDSQETKEKQ